MVTAEREHVRVHIGTAECMWAIPTIAPGIFELDNFPISDVDYTSGDLVMVADNGSGELYVTGLAERRYQPACLQYDEALATEAATEKRRELRRYFEAVGCRLEWLTPGFCGVSVPVRMTKRAFADVVQRAPCDVRWTDFDDGNS